MEPIRDDATRRAHLLRAGHLLSSAELPADADLADPSWVLAAAARLRAASVKVHDGADVPIVLQWLGESDAGRSILALSHLRRTTERGDGPRTS